MKWIKRCIALEFRTIRPFLSPKNLAIYLVVALFMWYGSKEAGALAGILLFIGNINMNYLFAVGEQNGIDVLYNTLPIERKHLVMARYLFVMLMFLFLGIFAFLLASFLNLWSGSMPPIETIFSIIGIQAVFLPIVFFQLPIYFKLGYTKGKNFAYIPLFAFFILFMAFINFVSDNESIQNALRLIRFPSFIAQPFILVLLFLILATVSYSLSLRFYTRRDF